MIPKKFFPEEGSWERPASSVQHGELAIALGVEVKKSPSVIFLRQCEPPLRTPTSAHRDTRPNALRKRGGAVSGSDERERFHLMEGENAEFGNLVNFFLKKFLVPNRADITVVRRVHTAAETASAVVSGWRPVPVDVCFVCMR